MELDDVKHETIDRRMISAAIPEKHYQFLKVNKINITKFITMAIEDAMK